LTCLSQTTLLILTTNPTALKEEESTFDEESLGTQDTPQDKEKQSGRPQGQQQGHCHHAHTKEAHLFKKTKKTESVDDIIHSLSRMSVKKSAP
jgi:hypothetical protein